MFEICNDLILAQRCRKGAVHPNILLRPAPVRRAARIRHLRHRARSHDPRRRARYRGERPLYGPPGAHQGQEGKASCRRDPPPLSCYRDPAREHARRCQLRRQGPRRLCGAEHLADESQWCGQTRSPGGQCIRASSRGSSCAKGMMHILDVGGSYQSTIPHPGRVLAGVAQ